MATDTAKAIEAILMVADQPVPPELFAQLLELQLDQITAVLDELMAGYEVEDRGFILTKVAGGYRYQSHPDQAPYVERFVLEGQTARLSAAALETLAIIAYKQPISRAQVAQVRGVNVDGVVKTLEQRGYIAEIGRDPGPGNPSLFGTTDVFLEKLGLASLADLPPIAGFVPGPDVVEQLEHGLRAEIDAETAAYVADLAQRADGAAAADAEAEAADDAAADAAVAGTSDASTVAAEPDAPGELAAAAPDQAPDDHPATDDASVDDEPTSEAPTDEAPADDVPTSEAPDVAPQIDEGSDDGAAPDDDAPPVDEGPSAADAGPGIDHDGGYGDPADATAGIDPGATFADPGEDRVAVTTDAAPEDEAIGSAGAPADGEVDDRADGVDTPDGTDAV